MLLRLLLMRLLLADSTERIFYHCCTDFTLIPNITAPNECIHDNIKHNSIIVAKNNLYRVYFDREIK